MARKPYPGDVTDEEWAFVAPYLSLMREDAPQREHSLREVFNGLRHFVRGGQAWRMLPNDLPPWDAVYGQARRWMGAGVSEAMAQDLRRLLRVLSGRAEEPTAAVFDSRTAQSTPESGGRAGYDGAKRRKGSKTHMAVDTLGHLLALHVTAADAGRTGRRSRAWPPTCRRRRATRSSWRSSTRATPGIRPPGTRRRRASSCRS